MSIQNPLLSTQLPLIQGQFTTSFWNKYKNYILGSVAVIIVGVVGYFIYKRFKKNTRDKIDYSGVECPNSKKLRRMSVSRNFSSENKISNTSHIPCQDDNSRYLISDINQLSAKAYTIINNKDDPPSPSSINYYTIAITDAAKVIEKIVHLPQCNSPVPTDTPYSLCCFINCTTRTGLDCKNDSGQDCINCLNLCKRNPYGFHCL